ncbi:MAG: DinB family protein [Acidobacteriaceae bacterium]|nr:DinB family protein [Acidobacteriaceae bacterium]
MATAVANPYATQLGNRNAREVIAETPHKLHGLLEKLGPSGLERSLAPGKWSARMILCHLADCEIAFAFRLRQALAEPKHVIQPFDQDAWARSYGELFSAREAVNLFSAIRGWNLTLLDSTPAAALSKPVNHPERGDMTFQTIVETMGGHDLNHLRQLETLAG